VEYQFVLWTNFQKLVPLKSFYLFLFLEQKGKFQVILPEYFSLEGFQAFI